MLEVSFHFSTFVVNARERYEGGESEEFIFWCFDGVFVLARNNRGLCKLYFIVTKLKTGTNNKKMSREGVGFEFIG